jgi:A/G-specific adenine glycosylase
MDLQLFFKKNLLHWNTNTNKRQMPWKGVKDPYKIWLSEIILQQTRVEQGWVYYENFISTYPNILQLAAAKDDDVFKMWEGLGYYSRCKNLLATARLIADKYAGKFPDTYTEILGLKGVGPYTAAAISSFAYNLPYAVVDGNVYRVLARFFGIETPTDSTEGKKFFSKLANQCLAEKQAGLYNQAIMDFGATVCTPALPTCASCVLQKKCAAFLRQKQQLLPVKEKVLKKKTRYFNYFIIEHGGNILIHKRTGKDIWQNLHEFYLTESAESINWTDFSVLSLLKKQLGIDADVISRSSTFTQLLTHQTILTNFVLVRTKKDFILPNGFFLVPQKEMRQFAFPRVINQYLDTPFLQANLF